MKAYLKVGVLWLLAQQAIADDVIDSDAINALGIYRSAVSVVTEVGQYCANEVPDQNYRYLKEKEKWFSRHAKFYGPVQRIERKAVSAVKENFGELESEKFKQYLASEMDVQTKLFISELAQLDNLELRTKCTHLINGIKQGALDIDNSDPQSSKVILGLSSTY